MWNSGYDCFPLQLANHNFSFNFLTVITRYYRRVFRFVSLLTKAQIQRYTQIAKGWMRFVTGGETKELHAESGEECGTAAGK